MRVEVVRVFLILSSHRMIAREAGPAVFAFSFLDVGKTSSSCREVVEGREREASATGPSDGSDDSDGRDG